MVNYISNDTSLTFYGISNRKLLNQLNINDLVDEKYDIVLVKSTDLMNLWMMFI